MPRNTYIPVKNRAIGRGKHMDNVVLKKSFIVRLQTSSVRVGKGYGLKARYRRKSVRQGTRA